MKKMTRRIRRRGGREAGQQRSNWFVNSRDGGFIRKVLPSLEPKKFSVSEYFSKDFTMKKTAIKYLPVRFL
jgi:hypothetical protein